MDFEGRIEGRGVLVEQIPKKLLFFLKRVVPFHLADILFLYYSILSIFLTTAPSFYKTIYNSFILIF